MESIMDSLKMTKRKEKDNSFGLTASFIQVNGNKERGMELECGLPQKVTVIWVSGLKA